MKKEAIILAGGFGTRLKETVPDLPKCLAPVKSKPILHYIINYLIENGVDRIVFSLRYKSNLVIEFVKNNFGFIEYDFVVEKETLGTGGALALSLKNTKNDDVIVLNGDSIFKINLNNLYNFHHKTKSSFSIALKNISNPIRYGTVELNNKGKIIYFKEKDKTLSNGLINGGVYIVNKKFYLKNINNESFSLETDFLADDTDNKNIFGKIFNEYFIDIGIPEDYKRANIELF